MPHAYIFTVIIIIIIIIIIITVIIATVFVIVIFWFSHRYSISSYNLNFQVLPNNY